MDTLSLSQKVTKQDGYKSFLQLSCHIEHEILSTFFHHMYLLIAVTGFQHAENLKETLTTNELKYKAHYPS